MKVNNDLYWNKCPLCLSEIINVAGAIKYREPIFFTTTKIELVKNPKLAICHKCSSWFTQNIINENNAMMLYETGNSASKWPRSKSFEESKNKEIIARLNLYFKPNKMVLDIGANTGDLLDFARKNGCHTFAVEPSESSRDILNNKSHKSFSFIEDVSGKYDVITAFDLVEHMYELNSFIKKVSELLADDGVFILLTGDVESLSANLSKNRWWYLKEPVHIVFPSVTFFKKFSNMKVVSVDRTYASVGYKKPILIGFLKMIAKSIVRDGYDGLSSIGPDHILLTLKK